MKELLKLLTKLGGEEVLALSNQMNNRRTEGQLCTLTLIQNWLINKHKIIVFVIPAVLDRGIVFKYIVVDARTGIYSKKAESTYEPYSYTLALKSGIWSALTYLQ